MVDETDVDLVRGFKWHLARSGHRRVTYARAELNIKKKRIKVLMHRLILDLRPGEFCDHVDGDGLNNQRANLRRCTRAENMRNRRKRKTSERSPYKGVYAYNGGKKWIALIVSPELKRQVTIGIFDDPVTAARAYDVEAKKMFGEFSCLNFPDTT